MTTRKQPYDVNNTLFDWLINIAEPEDALCSSHFTDSYRFDIQIHMTPLFRWDGREIFNISVSWIVAVTEMA